MTGKKPAVTKGVTPSKVGAKPEVSGGSAEKHKPPPKSPEPAARHAASTKLTSAPAAKKSPTQRIVRPSVHPAESDPAANQLLARAEADIGAAIEALNNQMNAALTKLTDLASAQCARGQSVVRTAPLDRATATFQRLVAEVVDDQQAEMLPPLIALRNELAQRAAEDTANQARDDDFHRRGTETLDHVFTLAGVQTYHARVGEVFDPLIHLAVGEGHRNDLPVGAVAEHVQPGFRSARGKVLVAAKVLVNRR